MKVYVTCINPSNCNVYRSVENVELSKKPNEEGWITGKDRFPTEFFEKELLEKVDTDYNSVGSYRIFTFDRDKYAELSLKAVKMACKKAEAKAKKLLEKAKKTLKKEKHIVADKVKLHLETPKNIYY